MTRGADYLAKKCNVNNDSGLWRFLPAGWCGEGAEKYAKYAIVMQFFRDPSRAKYRLSAAEMELSLQLFHGMSHNDVGGGEVGCRNGQDFRFSTGTNGGLFASYSGASATSGGDLRSFRASMVDGRTVIIWRGPRMGVSPGEIAWWGGNVCVTVNQGEGRVLGS